MSWTKVIVIDNKKVCTLCGELKDLSEFYYTPRKGRRHHYSQRCKSCLILLAKENEIKNKKPCPICGNLIHKKSKYCRKCLLKTDEYLESRKNMPKRQSKKEKQYCIDCGIEIYDYSKRCMRCSRSGKLNPRWKGGVSTLQMRIRKLFEYRQWRSDIYTRDEYTCVECGHQGSGLQAHHIIPFNVLLQKYEIITIEQAVQCDELWNINNGITLCKTCHLNLHKERGYKHGAKCKR